VIRVWDGLFALDPSLELVNYICVAMLLRIRWQRKPLVLISRVAHFLTDNAVVQADVNEALSLLLRYPQPAAQHPPVTFLDDAIALQKSVTIDTGRDLIVKHTNRAPSFRPRTEQRPSTPSQSNRNRTSSILRTQSPFGSPSLPFESLIADAAKGVLSRGEKWGFNQVVRDAMGEVRKNVQNLQQAGRGPPSPKPTTRNNRPRLHRPNRSDASSTIAANVLRKLTAVEERNKQLAKMLEAAVNDLWQYQKHASETEEGAGVGKGALDGLSVAIAKAQFVQVYLSDSGLPLPEEDSKAPSENEHGSVEQPAEEKPAPSASELHAQAGSGEFEPMPSAQDHNSSATALEKTKEAILAPSPLPAIDRTSAPQTPPPGIPTIALSSQQALSTSPTSRPPLAQSSFSWMLGQTHQGSFTTPSQWSPNEKRHNAMRDKGFLFGEDEDDFAAEEESQPTKKPAKGKPKKKREHIGLGAITTASGTDDSMP
jgi:TBC1 domain family member 5